MAYTYRAQNYFIIITIIIIIIYLLIYLLTYLLHGAESFLRS
jgi:hypothetical protein